MTTRSQRLTLLRSFQRNIMDTIERPPVYAGSPSDNYVRYCRDHGIWAKLTSGQQAVLQALASYADWRTGNSRPAITTVAERIGRDRGHVGRLLRQLVEDGVIEQVGWHMTDDGYWIKVWKLIGYDRFVDHATRAEKSRMSPGEWAAAFEDSKIHLASAPALHEQTPDPEHQQQTTPPAEPEADQLLADHGVHAAADRAVILRKYRPKLERLRVLAKLFTSWSGKRIANAGGWWQSALSGMFDGRLQQAASLKRTATQPSWMTRWSSVATEVRNRVLDDLLALPRISQSDRRHFMLVREGKAAPTMTLASIVLERAAG